MLASWGMLASIVILGDMKGSAGGAWNKLGELTPILTSRGASLKVKGKVYSACVQCVMTYGSETWPMRVEDMRHLERAEQMMNR
jgi:hypothetical protein